MKYPKNLIYDIFECKDNSEFYKIYRRIDETRLNSFMKAILTNASWGRDELINCYKSYKPLTQKAKNALIWLQKADKKYLYKNKVNETWVNTTVEQLGLTQRTLNALYFNSIYSLQDLYDSKDILKMLPKIGIKTRYEIQEALKKFKEENYET